jgi:hypothetical protein
VPPTARPCWGLARCTRRGRTSLGEEFAHLVDDVDKHRRTDIDAYGATNPAEFFAVVTEMFFRETGAAQARTVNRILANGPEVSSRIQSRCSSHRSWTQHAGT